MFEIFVVSHTEQANERDYVFTSEDKARAYLTQSASLSGNAYITKYEYELSEAGIKDLLLQVIEGYTVIGLNRPGFAGDLQPD